MKRSLARFAISLFVASAAFACFVGAALADEHTWTNGSGGLWSDGANWNKGTAPVDGDTVLFPTFGPATIHAANDLAPGLKLGGITVLDH